mmetsp:Transcript_1979/g.4004  ORF Transcript_1979/g.4004 Transcript_1979/m.4004 type:complete len:206 (+) Transcript_1979:488-1105(+)
MKTAIKTGGLLAELSTQLVVHAAPSTATTGFAFVVVSGGRRGVVAYRRRQRHVRQRSCLLLPLLLPLHSTSTGRWCRRRTTRRLAHRTGACCCLVTFGQLFCRRRRHVFFLLALELFLLGEEALLERAVPQPLLKVGSPNRRARLLLSSGPKEEPAQHARNRHRGHGGQQNVHRRASTGQEPDPPFLAHDAAQQLHAPPQTRVRL